MVSTTQHDLPQPSDSTPT